MVDVPQQTLRPQAYKTQQTQHNERCTSYLTVAADPCNPVSCAMLVLKCPLKQSGSLEDRLRLPGGLGDRNQKLRRNMEQHGQGQHGQGQYSLSATVVVCLHASFCGIIICLRVTPAKTHLVSVRAATFRTDFRQWEMQQELGSTGSVKRTRRPTRRQRSGGRGIQMMSSANSSTRYQGPTKSYDSSVQTWLLRHSQINLSP